MAKPIQLITSVNATSYPTPMVDAQMPLGSELTFVDGNGIKATLKYVQAGAAGMAANGLYFIEPGYVTSVPASSVVPKEFCLAEIAFTALYYGWVKVEGMGIAITGAGGSVALNTGSLADGLTTVLDEAAAAETALTVCTNNETDLAGGVPISVTLLRKRVTVA